MIAPMPATAPFHQVTPRICLTLLLAVMTLGTNRSAHAQSGFTWTHTPGICSPAVQGAVFAIVSSDCGGSGTSFDTEQALAPGILKDVSSTGAPCAGVPLGGGMSNVGRIDQTFATTPGQTYYVSAYIRINQQTVAPTWGGLSAGIVNSNWSQLAASSYLNTANSPAGQWTRITFTFVANTSQARLIYQNFSNGQFDASADSFIVSTAPIP